jgi:transposase
VGNAIGKLLRLQGWRVLGVEEQEDRVRVRVERSRAAAACPDCARESRRVHARGRERRLWHGVVVGRRVELLTRANRLWCAGCAKAFTAPLPQIGKWQRRTDPAEIYLRQELQTQSFGTVSRKTGLGYWALRRVVERSIAPVCWESLLEQAQGQGLVLGVDEHSFRHQDMVITITEIRQHRVLTLLPDDRCCTLEAFFLGLRSEVRDEIREVCIDMKEGFRKTIERCLPKARVVADPFHVIQDANSRLDEARQIEQQMRKTTLKKSHSSLGKSGFTRDSANTCRTSWSASLPCASTTWSRNGCANSIGSPTEMQPRL